jgi:hypothetical protein
LDTNHTSSLSHTAAQSPENFRGQNRGCHRAKIRFFGRLGRLDDSTAATARSAGYSLHLDARDASEDLSEVQIAHPLCELDANPIDLTYLSGRHRLPFHGKR